MLLGIGDLPVSGKVQLTDRCNNLKTGHAEDEIEPELVVSFSGAPVGDTVRPFFHGHTDDLFRDQGPGKRRTHGISLVGPVRPDCREHVLVDELLPGIDGIMLVGEFLPFLGGHRDLIVPLSHIDRDSDHPVKPVPLF